MADHVFGERPARRVFGAHRAAMQEPGVDGVDRALQDLEVIALHLRGPGLAGGDHVRFERGQGWGGSTRAEGGPHDPAAFLGWIGDGLDFAFEVTLGWFVGHVETVALDVELPAVIDAAQARFLVASKEETRSAVWAVVPNESDLPGSVTEGDQLFAQ